MIRSPLLLAALALLVALGSGCVDDAEARSRLRTMARTAAGGSVPWSNNYSLEFTTQAGTYAQAADSALWECTTQITIWGCLKVDDVGNGDDALYTKAGVAGALEYSVVTINNDGSNVYQSSFAINNIANFCRNTGWSQGQWYCAIFSYNGGESAGNDNRMDVWRTTPGTAFTEPLACTSVNGTVPASITVSASPLSIGRLEGSTCPNGTGCPFGTGNLDHWGHACTGKIDLATAQCIFPSGRPGGNPSACLSDARAVWYFENEGTTLVNQASGATPAMTITGTDYTFEALVP